MKVCEILYIDYFIQIYPNLKLTIHYIPKFELNLLTNYHQSYN